MEPNSGESSRKGQSLPSSNDFPSGSPAVPGRTSGRGGRRALRLAAPRPPKHPPCWGTGCPPAADAGQAGQGIWQNVK